MREREGTNGARRLSTAELDYLPASRRRRGGFTLVEALAAGIILAMAGAVLGGSLSQTYESLNVARDNQRAAELLDEVLTRIDMIGPERLGREGPTEGRFQGDDRFSWRAQISPRLQGHLYEVTAVVSWATPRGQRSVQAQTLLNDPPGSRDASLDWDSL